MKSYIDLNSQLPPLLKMKSLVTLVLLGCLAVAAVTYAKPQDGNQVFAPAPHNPRDCYCQCSGLGFTDGSGVRHGNCRT